MRYACHFCFKMKFGIIEVIATGLKDSWPEIFKGREMWLKLAICMVEFLLGLTCVTRVSWVYELIPFWVNLDLVHPKYYIYNWLKR